HTCRRNSASMIFDASTSFANTCLSAAESVDRSAVILVGAKRAAIFCNLTVSGTTASCAATLTAHNAAIHATARNIDMGTFYLSRRGWRLEVGGWRLEVGGWRLGTRGLGK